MTAEDPDIMEYLVVASLQNCTIIFLTFKLAAPYLNTPLIFLRKSLFRKGQDNSIMS